ncbi:MAG: NAD+ synthase [Candidatus Omnitrophota bacterium]
MKITLAQINPVIGDIETNFKKIINVLDEFAMESDVVVFSELCLTGYPPKDLLENDHFIDEARDKLNEVAEYSKKYKDTGIILGAPVRAGRRTDKKLYNSAIFICNGGIRDVIPKALLPVYDVFDETRYFAPALNIKAIKFKGEKLGISICEDMWNSIELREQAGYTVDPIEELVKDGASILINISASPFCLGKEEFRHNLVRKHAIKYRVPFVFVNQIGGNDELIFDGRSMCVDAKGNDLALFPGFEEKVAVVDIKAEGQGFYIPQDKMESIYKALVLGVQDYVKKCGFSKAVIGLSGGIDSAVVACLAQTALAKENVVGFYMPSMYSSDESLECAQKLACNLDINFKIISINAVYLEYIQTLKKDMEIDDNAEIDVYLQNIQARIRGNILMAFSNKYGHLLLATGNKSELAVGYCTLYGDMAGGLAVISDVPKTMIYELAGYINKDKEIIPQKIIDRAPSAELRPGQIDQDILPAYDILDKVLYYYLEERRTLREIQKKGIDSSIIKWVVDSINKNEYKRRQAPPGLKVTSKAFGSGRRMPIAAKY